MRLKKEIKEKLIYVGLIIGIILSLTIIAFTGEKAYEECMNKHNDVNFCHKLVE